jgi:hypothetical protein
VHSASFVELGNGKRAKFWTDRWLPCHRSIMEAFPILASYVRVSGISVAEALVGNRWIRDVRGGVSTQAINQYLHLWDLTSSVHLVATSEDRLIWRHTEDGQFSTSSAYSLFFAANTRFPCASEIWKSKAPACCKFFMWLVVHKRCLTADNLQKRGWPHSSTCRLCLRAPESCTIVARFGIGGAFRDPGSIDPDRGSGTRVDRYNSLLSRDPVRVRYVSILVLILGSLIYIWAYLGLLIPLILSVIFGPINILNFKHHIWDY